MMIIMKAVGNLHCLQLYPSGSLITA